MLDTTDHMDKPQFNQTLAVLNKISSTLTAIQDLSKVLRKIAEDAKDVLGADIVDLYEYNQVQEEFVLPPILVGKRWHPHVPKEKIYDDDVVVKVIKTGEPEYFPNSQANALLTEEFMVPRKDAPDERFVIREGVVSSVSLPLKAGQEIVGVMFVNFRTGQSFDRDQKKLIESFSNLAAIAIHNARLWKVQEDASKLRQSTIVRLNEQLEHLHQVISEQDLDSVLDRILESVIQLMGSGTSSSINLYDAALDKFTTILAKGELREHLLIPPRAEGTARHVIGKQQALYIADVHKPPLGSPTLRSKAVELGISSFAAIPIIRKNNLLGVLFVHQENFIRFATDVQQMLETFASQAAVAIENARLYAELQALLSALPDLVIVYDQDGYYVDIAPTSPPKYLYETADEMIGKTVYEVLPKQQADICFTAIQESLQRHEIVKIEYGLNIEGKDRWFDARVFPMASDRVVFVARDITERKEDEKKLQQLHNRRSSDIAALQEINKAVISRKLPEIIQLITKKATEILESEYGGIWLMDFKSQELILQTSSHPEYVDDSYRIRPSETSINRKVYEDRESYICPDANADPNYYRVYEDARSSVTSPLIFQDHVIGTINVESSKIDAFDDQNKELLESFASQAAIAIENARYNKALGRKNKNLGAVLSMGQALTASVDLDEKQVVELIHEQLSSLIYADNMYIALYDAATDMVSFPMIFVDGAETNVPSRKAGAGRTEYIIENKEPLFIETREESEKWYAQPGRGEYLGDPLASWVGVPMISGNQVIGIVAAYHKTDDYVYSQDDVEVLQAIANQSAIALEVVKKVSELKASQNLDMDWL